MKRELYKSLLEELSYLIEGENDLIALLANVSACIKAKTNFHWVGFYLVKGEELVLGPFQGPPACSRIKFGRGVCGSSWKEKKILVVPDVNQFEGHIACSSLSRSEIVLPLIKENSVIGVMDIDSIHLDEFDEIDEEYLTKISELLIKQIL